LLEGAVETVAALAARHRLLLITKGDLRDQERKLAKSNLSAHFHHVEIVSEKDSAAYAGIFRHYGIAQKNFLMGGNPLKSDILPVLARGGAGALIPSHLMWAAERVDEAPAVPGRFFHLGSLLELPDVVSRILSAEV